MATLSLSRASSLAVDLQWYEIRDTLLGQNGEKQNVQRAYQLACACSHPEARWLAHVFDGKDVQTENEAADVFLALGENDARSLCFAALIVYDDEFDARLRRSAELGYAFAQCTLSLFVGPDEAFYWAERAALQGERDGFHALSDYFRVGHGCELNWEKAKENLFRAARLGNFNAMLEAAKTLPMSDPEYWKFLGRAAAKGEAHRFVDHFSDVVVTFKTRPSLAPAVFAIGQALHGHVNAEKREIFGASRSFDSRIASANAALDFFFAQCRAARLAVDTWTLIAFRAGNSFLNKDIRKLVGRLIWQGREEANYELDYKNI